jgi:hypothetical protein
MNLDTSKIVDIELDGINIHDWPDLADAFISSAWLEIPIQGIGNFSKNDPNICVNNGKCFRKLQDCELEWLEKNKKDWYSDYIYKHAMDYFY